MATHFTDIPLRSVIVHATIMFSEMRLLSDFLDGTERMSDTVQRLFAHDVVAADSVNL